MLYFAIKQINWNKWRDHCPWKGLRRVPQLIEVLLGAVQKVREICSGDHHR